MTKKLSDLEKETNQFLRKLRNTREAGEKAMKAAKEGTTSKEEQVRNKIDDLLASIGLEVFSTPRVDIENDQVTVSITLKIESVDEFLVADEPFRLVIGDNGWPVEIIDKADKVLATSPDGNWWSVVDGVVLTSELDVFITSLANIG
jgi:hypothetical protein